MRRRGWDEENEWCIGEGGGRGKSLGGGFIGWEGKKSIMKKLNY